VGLGFGFWTLLADSNVSLVHVAFEPVILCGCVFIIINCAGVVAAALYNNQRLPERVGWAMVAWYFVYLAAVVGIISTQRMVP
jgi:hypothetical protein